MARIRVQVALPRDTNLPEDVSTNTWHFSTSGLPLDAAAADAIHAGLDAFYQSVDTYLASVLANPVAMKFYDLDDPKPRPPKQERAMVLNYGSAATAEESAICLSFAGAPAAGVPAGRRRGRIFLGPLTTGLTQIVEGRVRVFDAAQAAIALAGDALLQAHGPEDPYKWSVYSVTDDAMIPVTRGWVDNAFDTVRSRGPKPSGRATFPA